MHFSGTAIQSQYIQSQHILSQHLVSTYSQTICLILIITIFSRYLYSLIKVYKKLVSIFSGLRVNCSRSRQNVMTNCVGTKCVGTKKQGRNSNKIDWQTVPTSYIRQTKSGERINFKPLKSFAVEKIALTKLSIKCFISHYFQSIFGLLMISVLRDIV